MERANKDSDVEKHLIGYVEGDNVKIFPQGEPLPIEVKQAAIGDCYLMSTLISLAKTSVGKKAIEKCFIQGLDKIEKEDNIIIRFFDSTKEKIGKQIRITVNKKKVIMPQRIRGGALWPKLIEKAYAVYRKEGYERGIEKKNLHRGHAWLSMFAITGKRTGQIDVTGGVTGTQQKINYLRGTIPTKDKYKSANIIGTIKSKLKENRALVCSFKDSFKVTDAKNLHETVEISDDHGYAIVGFGKNTKGEEYIRLIDSNKVWGRTYNPSINTDRIEPPKGGGHIAMLFNDFEKHIKLLDYTSGHEY